LWTHPRLPQPINISQRLGEAPALDKAVLAGGRRHYGLFANTNRAESIARARELLGAEPRVVEPEEKKAAAPDEPRVLPCPCPRCGGRMIVIEVFAKGAEPSCRQTPPSATIRIDTS
jgi:hypothetical protein